MRRPLLLAAIVLLVSAAPPAGAVDPVRGDVTGRCRMTLADLGDTIRVRYVLRTDRPHRDWRLAIFDDGVRVFSRRYTTGPRGDFVARAKIPDPGGVRRYVGRATDLVSRSRCQIALSG